MVIKNGTDDILTRERRIVMVRFGKKAALLAMAGVLTAASVTGCSGAIDAEATVVTRDVSSGKHVPHLTAFRRIRSRSNGR